MSAPSRVSSVLLPTVLWRAVSRVIPRVEREGLLLLPVGYAGNIAALPGSPPSQSWLSEETGCAAQPPYNGPSVPQTHTALRHDDP